MNRIHRTIICLLIASLPCLAQTDDESWLSWSRFSLSVSSSYFVNSWDNYNRAAETAARSIQEDPFFIEPRGFYETVKGAGAVEVVVSYRALDRVNVLLTGGYGELRAGMEFYPDPTLLPAQFRSLAFHQQISYEQQSYGIGAQYEIPVLNNVVLTAGATLEYIRGDMNVRWRHNRNATGPLAEDEGERLSADLSSTAAGMNFLGGVQCRVWGPVHLAGQIRYRMATLKKLKGPATFAFSSGTARPFTAELVEAPNFFGVGVKEQPADPSMRVFLPPLTFLTEPDVRARVPALLNLNAFGFTGGILIQF